MKKHSTRKLLSLLLALAMLLSLIPATALATEPETVYITISDDGQFIADPNGAPMAYRAVALDALNAIDLADYNLGNYKYDADGDGNYEITALHLYIYVHEQILGLDFVDVDTSNGYPGSMYFSGGLFGFADENMRYDYNGAYPANEEGWGLTADNIILANGDYLDIAHYSDWMFYCDSAYGFNYFADETGAVTHAYAAEAGSAAQVKLIRSGGGMGMGTTVTAVADHPVYYGAEIGVAQDTVNTDGSGYAEITFPSAGTWYVWCDGGEGVDSACGAIVSSPASAVVTVTAKEEEKPEDPREPQDVSAVLNATMAQLAATVTEPTFGTSAGEWTVLSLARGDYYAKDSAYFAGYYDRIVETVNTKAASVNLNGALHKNKSTDNSRLIVALSSIGKDATSVGEWNLVAPYDDFNWIKKQGNNGVIWALIALDSHDYETTDTTIRQQCIDYILDAQLTDGGWGLSSTTADTDTTGMALQALAPYASDEEVQAAAERAFAYLSEMQQEGGGFIYGSNGETSESAAQVIVACTAWGIDPDTDERFVKNGKSAVDGLLAYYLKDSATFEHQLGAGANGMATDQACYALVAYDRFQNKENALYDMSDVVFESVNDKDDETEDDGDDNGTDDNGTDDNGTDDNGTGDNGNGENTADGTVTASLGLPTNISGKAGTAFNATIIVDEFDNDAGYKLIDFIVTVPAGLEVTGVTAGATLNGGSVNYNLEEGTGKLRAVYFDANNNATITVSGTQFPAELFTIGFKLKSDVENGSFRIAVTGMSLKKSSDSAKEEDMLVVDTAAASASVKVATEITYSAVCLYEGDDVDLIPKTKKAIAVAVTADIANLTYADGTNTISFRRSPEIEKTFGEKSGLTCFVALVDASIEDGAFANPENYETDGQAKDIAFGDANGDGLVNAQDALAAVDAWLRKGDAPNDDEILTLNVNGDSRINTFDALGIVEHFVNNSSSTFGVVTKAAKLGTNS